MAEVVAESKTAGSTDADAGTTLHAEAQAASSTSALSDAYDDYAEALVLAESSASVIGEFAGVLTFDADALLASCDGAAVRLEDALWAAASSDLNASSDVDAMAVGDHMASAWTSSESEVSAETTPALPGIAGSDLDLTSAVMAQASGSFRGAYVNQW